MQAEHKRWWAPRAWLVQGGQGGWHDNVLLVAGQDGCWSQVTPDVPAAIDATHLDGPVLPGLVDAHSHAFQRAFAGLAERRERAHDDFWSWRDRMYRVALRVEPDTLRAIAAGLYVELLNGGYTEVCEFHYLQHRPDGAPYADPLAMSRALGEAATSAGIGLTLLPVLYERAGFAAPALRDDQRRFRTDAAAVLALRDGSRALGLRHVRSGVAVHSLRAARPDSIARLLDGLSDDGGPIHVHVSEQPREVEECLDATGMRPIEWLARHVGLDERWQLVHATHASAAEIDAVAHAGAGVVLCPTTEANLGDGVTELGHWLAAGVPLALGSDSNVTRAWWDELRILEYGQRLALGRRNVAATAREPSTAAALLASSLHGGGRAAGFARWGLEAGARADLVVADTREPALVGVPGDALLDAIAFSGPARPVRHVMIAGQWVLRDRVHAHGDAIAAAFRDAMRALWIDR